MVSRSALPERRCMDRPLNTDRTGRKSCRKIKSIAKLNFLRIFSLGFPRWKYSGYFALHEPVHCQKVGNSGQQIWWNFKTRSWKNGQGVLEYSPTRNLCSGSPRRSWSNWTKNGLPMGRSIWKVDGRDSENLQKKRYVAQFMQSPSKRPKKADRRLGFSTWHSKITPEIFRPAVEKTDKVY